MSSKAARESLHLLRQMRLAVLGLKVLCAPKWNEFEFPIIKTRNSESKLAQVPDQSEFHSSGSLGAAEHL